MDGTPNANYLTFDLQKTRVRKLVVARTRLYSMGRSKYLDEEGENFEIYGEWHPFGLKVDYGSFLVKQKETDCYEDRGD